MNAVSVGQSVEILGANFAHGSTGHAVVLFEGEYHAKSGETNPVSYEIRPHWEDGNRLVWSHVGPYQVPFTPSGDQIGTFIGTATVINVTKEGAETFSEPADIELEILPSVIVTSLAPVESDCIEPSKIILDNFAYWDEIDTHYRGTVVRSTGHGFAGISRHTLLAILRLHCARKANGRAKCATKSSKG